jgi:hypothetical protein
MLSWTPVTGIFVAVATGMLEATSLQTTELHRATTMVHLSFPRTGKNLTPRVPAVTHLRVPRDVLGSRNLAENLLPQRRALRRILRRLLSVPPGTLCLLRIRMPTTNWKKHRLPLRMRTMMT